MKNVKYAILIISAILSLNSSAFAFLSSDVSNHQISDTLRGSFFYLKNMQLKNGEWANQIQVLPLVPNVSPEGNKLALQDSNMFVTAAIVYPLFWLTDVDHQTDEMLHQAVNSIKPYKRGQAYNFWPQYISRNTGNKVVGPVNFRVDNIDISHSSVGSVASKVLGHSFPWVEEWMKQIMNPQLNPGGMESFFNVPNDADDTSMAMAVFAMDARANGTQKDLDLSPLAVVSQYRDTDRIKFDSRTSWTQKNSGAFLTWLKDESLETFGDPNTGVMPLGVNNVDCVVNANALFSLALNDMTSTPGYAESAHYLSEVIQSSQWLKQCALYYPQKYTFPYSVTRAYRDAGARTPELEKAMDKLLTDLLSEQTKRGYWDSTVDGTHHYATAMALVSLLNLGEQRAQRLGLIESYNDAIQRAIKFLYYTKLEHKFTSDNIHTIYSWKPGLFFSAEEPKLGVWRSTALTNAIVLEAFAKYLMNYQKSDESLKTWKSRLPVEFLKRE